jgi:hypothetical protein
MATGADQHQTDRCGHSLPISLPIAAYLAQPRKPLRQMAEQVLRDVDQRSRFARRHAGELARAVLDALAARPEPAAAPGPSRRSPAFIMAEIAQLAVDAPEVVSSLAEFAGR